MNTIREWSFPVAVLTAWIAVAGYTLSSLGQTHAAVAAAQKPAVAAPAFEETIEVTAKPVTLVRKAHKQAHHHQPRS